MLQINVSQLCISRADETVAALEQIPAMQRRRLSGIAKLALSSAIQSLNSKSADYIVWASQYGDEHKTLKILADVLQDQTPSPTQFSTSVHNAIAGLYSILCQDATPSTSLAASWSEALIEAYAWLKTATQPNPRVLVVYYDETLPEIYHEAEPFIAFAMSAMVSLEAPNLQLDIHALGNHRHKYIDAQNFYDFWQQSEQRLDYPQTQAWQKC
ncbi:beta-ketoacyl synthase chain length factor [Acinetobacter sp. C_4_1]|uniref:beta-ketoacyl synthase chain length factor n=1 Tax=unclassified Acinetobacter TaxID=196816 RepID=UPI0021B81325|nr:MULTISPECIES: beta-ketoacyl synthase chain length factor [unclassified Acinetobacter]MCT8090162.1 beta-ketoacyl synthase chain length factor [Acinetobacter sp. F_3_1]MCT8098638.1 beta-ketoacyl synthase chain length factor [Acinetobacter sp. C_3_1]MCT8101710.1 beta-ketoacyl synthase chain length factor [Acinetobacter sp. C_4_1]MCT8135532.1 beta-ketoacyl synthase chain length factor [Acinetobacter sp. T_3_1]